MTFFGDTIDTFGERVKQMWKNFYDMNKPKEK